MEKAGVLEKPPVSKEQPVVNKPRNIPSIVAMVGVGLLSVLMLTEVFISNPCQVGPPGRFEDFEKGADAGTFLTVERSLDHGLFEHYGLVTMTNGKVYTSHCGMNGILPGILIRLTGKSMAEFVPFYYRFTSFMLALGLTLFALVLIREFGWAAGIVFLLLVPCADWIVFAGRNISYLFYFYVFPFFAAWLLYPRVQSGRMKMWAFLSIIGALVFLKATAGYEFITNVILGATVAPLYYGVSQKRSWQEISKSMAKVVAVGVFAFLMAATVNLLQNAAYYGSLSKGFQAIAQKAAARTMGGKDSSFEGSGGNDSAPADLPVSRILHGYMTFPGASLPLGDRQPRIYLTLFTFFSSVWVLGLMALVDGRVFPVFGKLRAPLVGFALALVWSLVCTFTWPLVAKGFMYHHMHIAAMAFYVTYMIMALAGFGILVSLVLRQAFYFIVNGYKRGSLTASTD
ncbi:MAG TPA: hypothetical protein DCZ95_09525 [Verrucomicrobia bacterium]|nr:hypothetical protein [Verrucomicrobiota bacterium]